MTNKEAIEILKDEWRINAELFGKQYDEALDLAIKALDAMPIESITTKDGMTLSLKKN